MAIGEVDLRLLEEAHSFFPISLVQCFIALRAPPGSATSAISHLEEERRVVDVFSHTHTPSTKLPTRRRTQFIDGHPLVLTIALECTVRVASATHAALIAR